MNKIKVEDMACFEQIAKVIGVANAKRELFIAVKSEWCEPDNRLGGSFDWEFTPQGYEFWRDIARRVNPYNQ